MPTWGPIHQHNSNLCSLAPTSIWESRLHLRDIMRKIPLRLPRIKTTKSGSKFAGFNELDLVDNAVMKHLRRNSGTNSNVARTRWLAQSFDHANIWQNVKTTVDSTATRLPRPAEISIQILRCIAADTKPLALGNRVGDRAAHRPVPLISKSFRSIYLNHPYSV